MSFSSFTTHILNLICLISINLDLIVFTWDFKLSGFKLRSELERDGDGGLWSTN